MSAASGTRQRARAPREPWRAAVLLLALLEALVVCVALSACGAPAASSGATTSVPTSTAAAPMPKVVRFAFAGPLTGPNAIYGQGMLRAAKLAVAQASRLPNVARAGYRFELVSYDDGSDPTRAVSVAKRIAARRDIVGVVGHFDSGCSIPASSVYHQAGMMMVSVSSDPALTAKGYANVFRVVTRDDVQGTFAADLVTGPLGAKRVAVLSDTSTYGTNLVDEFVKRLGQLGGGVVYREQIPASQQDVSALVARVGAVGPQVVYFAGDYKLAARISRELKDANVDATFVGGDTLFSKAYLDAAGGAAADGDICTALGLPLTEQPGYDTFQRLYKAAYPKETPGPYDSYAFDAAWIVMDSVIGAGWDASPAARITYTHAHPFDNVTGQAVFDARGDTSNQTVSAYRVTGGTWVLTKQ